jgi:hypothetical protein
MMNTDKINAIVAIIANDITIESTVIVVLG